MAKKIRAGDGIDVSVSTPDGGIVVSSTVEIPEIPTVPGHTAGANVRISDSGSDKVFRTWAQQGLLWYMYLDSGIGYVTLGGETPNSWEVLGTWNPEIA